MSTDWGPRIADAADQHDGQEPGGFKIVSLADISVRVSTDLLPGTLPDDELIVLIGEEGIGKGLFCADVIARVTKLGHNVLVIATEDDYERHLKPRLDVAGADPARIFLMVRDTETLQGQPTLPHNLLEVTEAIKSRKIRLVYSDPWVSSVSGGLRLYNTQEARRAIDPLTQLARSEHCSILAVAHPNRAEGDLRDRVGLTAVLRQSARVMIYALEPPEDQTKIIVGIEKANNAPRPPAAVYRKVPRDHPELPKPVWAVEEIEGEPLLTIRQWHDRYRKDRDQRQSDRWPDVQAVANANGGLVNRSDIVTIYEESGSDENSATKAISRWTKGGKLTTTGQRGVYGLAP